MDRRFFLEVLLFNCILLFAGEVNSNAIGDASDTQGLYSTSDSVFILNATNFHNNVYESNRTWLVEFYNSWCGYCRRYASVWKNLAKLVHGWRDITAIAAVDCADDDNNPLCREFEIMQYPTIKFFHIKPDKTFLGLDKDKLRDEFLLMYSLIDQLQKEQQEQRGGPTWPNIVPYWGSEIKILWNGAPSNIQYQFLIFEESDSYLGAQVILDLHTLDTIRIRRVFSKNHLVCVTSNVTKFPSLIVIGKDNLSINLKLNGTLTQDVENTILSFLKSKGLSVEMKQDVVENYDTETNKIQISAHSDDKLYQLDLESALRYSLNNEIPLSPIIFGEKLDALKAYLKVLALYFPIYLPKGKIYLQILSDTVSNKSEMTNKKFRELVRSNEKALTPVYAAPKTWIGCKGSTSTFRGYPCGLWTMFHTLSVAAAESSDNNVNNNDHPSVLVAMHGYIKNFFGCADCSEHFQEMAKRRKLFDVKGADESILWLWKTHNEVNQRLVGDPSEDPEHKKIQYPAAENCPKCRSSDGSWDEDEVLKYLKEKYSKSNLQGINDDLLKHEMYTSASSSGASNMKIHWDFTIFDISICVVLYVVSAMILTLVCIKFAYKKTHKKRVSFKNLFGLV